MDHMGGDGQAAIARPVNRRRLVALLAVALLSACKVIPKGPVEVQIPPEPSADVLPTDTERHRIALLVPMTGANAAVGQSIANATTMALLDTNAQNLRVTTYDTSTGPAEAARRALADGNKLILGPLLAEHIPAVITAVRAAKVPVISYSNDATAVARDVFIMGHLPSQSITRTIGYVKSQGVNRIGALIPAGEYGQRAETALLAAARANGVSVAASESFDRSNTSVASAARRLHARGGYDAVLIADGGRIAALAAPVLKAGGASPRLLGTELWSGENVVASTPALRGALFSAVSDSRFRQFSDSYRTRFGAQPYRIATLGYDSVLLTLRIARDWKPGTLFPTARMYDRSGFLGLDGAFRFNREGIVERALEVREVRAGGITVISPAPTKFAD